MFRKLAELYQELFKKTPVGKSRECSSDEKRNETNHIPVL